MFVGMTYSKMCVSIFHFFGVNFVNQSASLSQSNQSTSLTQSNQSASLSQSAGSTSPKHSLTSHPFPPNKKQDYLLTYFPLTASGQEPLSHISAPRKLSGSSVKKASSKASSGTQKMGHVFIPQPVYGINTANKNWLIVWLCLPMMWFEIGITIHTSVEDPCFLFLAGTWLCL